MQALRPKALSDDFLECGGKRGATPLLGLWKTASPLEFALSDRVCDSFSFVLCVHDRHI
jgi:hypothetical protein